MLIWKYWYGYYKYKINASPEELENRKIDEYNFWQLEKIKNTFESYSDNKRKINNLWYFVFEYGVNIVPIKNCYYVSNSNWKYDYIVWFKLESNKYKSKYWTEYYAYPDYDIKPMNICDWNSCDNDVNRYDFESVVDNPCKGIIRWIFYEDRNRNWVHDQKRDSRLEVWNWIFLDLNNDWHYWNYEPKSDFINDGYGSYDHDKYGNYEFNDLEQWVYTVWVINESNDWSYTQPKEWKYVININNNNLFIKDIDFWIYKEGTFH